MCGDENKLKWRNHIEVLPSLTFTPDSRGASFPSAESQIASNLVKNVFGFNDEQGSTSVYGSRYDAYSSLLTILLAEKKMNGINVLPDDGDKDAENIRLVNLLLRDLEFNLNNKGSQYLLKAANIFCDSYRKALSRDHSLSAKKIKEKLIASEEDGDQLYILRYALKQPIEIDYNQYPDSPRFFKLLDLFITIQCITEAMHQDHQPAGRRDGNDHHYKPRIDTHNIRSYLQCKSVGNLKLSYNENTNELKIVPTNGRVDNIKNNNLRMKNILSENKKIDKIKFTPFRSLRHIKNHSSVSSGIKKLITPEMYVNKTERHIDKYTLASVNTLGLILDGRSEYIRLGEEVYETKHIPYPPFINNRYVIEGNNNLYLRYREDEKFHPETHNERLDVDKIVDFIEIKPNVEPLTLDERHALRSYYSTPFTYSSDHGDKLIIRDIDQFIIKGMPKNYLTPDLRESMVKIINNIESALKKTTPYKGIVYKKTIITTEKFNNMKKGQLLTSKLFTCTKKRQSSEYLLNRYIDSHNLTSTHTVISYEFNIIKSGHSLEWYTERFNNDDVFIESNKHFKIINVHTDERELYNVVYYFHTVYVDEIDRSLLSNEEKDLAQNIDFEI